MADKPLPPDDDIADLLPKRKTSKGVIFIAAFVVLALTAVVWLYVKLGQRGLSVRGEGHLVVTEKAGTWAALLDGTLVRVTPDSARKLALRSGPCKSIEGALAEHELDIEIAECAGGEPLLRRVGERMQRMGLKFGYWPETIERKADTLEPHLGTPEIMASMIDPRFTEPQLLTIYTPLFPETIREARALGLPPPVIIQVKRNDFFIRRLTRTELAAFLSRERFILGAAASKGGWLVRTVEIGGPELPPIERLLMAPGEDPWPRLLQANPVRASFRPPPGSPGEPPPRPE